MSAVALTPHKWEQALRTTLAGFAEFDGTRLVLDRENSFNDQLSFDVVDFEGEIPSRVISALEKRYGSLVELTFEPHPLSSLRKQVTLTVNRPSSHVMDALVSLWTRKHAMFSARLPPWWLVLLLFVLFAGAAAHAASLLDDHTSDTAGSYSLIGHALVHQLARLWQWRS